MSQQPKLQLYEWEPQVKGIEVPKFVEHSYPLFQTVLLHQRQMNFYLFKIVESLFYRNIAFTIINMCTFLRQNDSSINQAHIEFYFLYSFHNYKIANSFTASGQVFANQILPLPLPRLEKKKSDIQGDYDQLQVQYLTHNASNILQLLSLLSPVSPFSFCISQFPINFLSLIPTMKSGPWFATQLLQHSPIKDIFASTDTRSILSLLLLYCVAKYNL